MKWNSNLFQSNSDSFVTCVFEFKDRNNMTYLNLSENEKSIVRLANNKTQLKLGDLENPFYSFDRIRIQ